MKELITVIINVYNGEKYIKNCLDCIINQTYKNLEILIINDGSTDNTLKICEEYKDKRIRIITTKNQGLSLSRNTGIDNSKGKYLYFIDVDDCIELDTIEYLHHLIKKYKAKMSTCKNIDSDDYNKTIKNKNEKIEVLDKKEMLKKVLITTNREVAIWNKLIKKELFDNLRFENRPINDIAFTYKLILKTKNIVYSNQIKYLHINNCESISNIKSNDETREIDRYKVCIERYKYIKKKYPELIENDIALIQIISRLYSKKNKKIKEYLIENNALKKYKKIFSLEKIKKCKLKKSTKIKLILFRINPKLHNIIVNKCLKLKER